MSINLFNNNSSTKDQLKRYLDESPNDSPFKKQKQKELLDGIFNASNKYILNPIYILSHAIHESDWGRSKISIDKNNLFGFQAYDNNSYDNAKQFKDYNECIDYCMKYIKNNYLTKGGLYYVDGTLKGMNKYYASDNLWLNKITNIYNEIEKFINNLPKEKEIINYNMNEMKSLECKYLFINLNNNKSYTFSGEKGKEILLLDLSQENKLLARWLNENPINKSLDNNSNSDNINNKIIYVDGDVICKNANSFVGKNFNPGATEQCAMFVRHILEISDYNIGITNSPSDGLPTGYALASSFSGDDIGLKISYIDKLLSGDIVMFKNTYGNWSDGVITHVGIYVGNNMFVHRPTSSKPVQKDNIIMYGHFKEGRRLLV